VAFCDGHFQNLRSADFFDKRRTRCCSAGITATDRTGRRKPLEFLPITAARVRPGGRRNMKFQTVLVGWSGFLTKPNVSSLAMGGMESFLS